MAKKGGLVHDASKGSVGKAMGSSAKMNVAAGSGSRPTKSKHAIKTSAPMEKQNLGGRRTKGALK
jgi:hypothetical protein